MRRIALTTLSTALLAAAAPLPAQTPPLKPERGYGGLAFVIAVPTGAFDDYVGTGFGAGGSFTLGLDHARMLGLRVDGGFINYGRETKRVCFSQTVGCRVEVDLTTNNNIFYGGVGPELTVPSGMLRPYVHAGIGFAYFATTSSVDDLGGGDGNIASTTNFDDVTFAWLAGGGLRIRLSSGKTPVHLDFGAEYHGNGEVEYLTKGGITDNPDGTIKLDPIRSEADLLAIRIGVSFGTRW